MRNDGNMHTIPLFCYVLAMVSEDDKIHCIVFADGKLQLMLDDQGYSLTIAKGDALQDGPRANLYKLGNLYYSRVISYS